MSRARQSPAPTPISQTVTPIAYRRPRQAPRGRSSRQITGKTSEHAVIHAQTHAIDEKAPLAQSDLDEIDIDLGSNKHTYTGTINTPILKNTQSTRRDGDMKWAKHPDSHHSCHFEPPSLPFLRSSQSVHLPKVGASAAVGHLASSGSHRALPPRGTKEITTSNSLPPDNTATPIPSRRGSVPTALPNVKPQLKASELFDCGPDLITAPMSCEQRRARILTIMPELKSLDDADIPLPTPYNAAYPHPISAYASPGVNQAALRISGYDKVLKQLLIEDPDHVKGAILASAADILPPALTMILNPGEGNGIPERLWTRFESIGGARLPVGAATPGPYARVEPAAGDPFSPYIDPVPPRFANKQPNHIPPPDRSGKNYFEFPRQTPINDINAWRSELSGANDLAVHPGSPWFKTEICPIWEDTGLCKYGKDCQYAHGFNELRSHPRMVPLPTPPPEHLPLPYAMEGMRPYVGRRGSCPSPPTPSQLEARRASAPARELSPVEEDIAPSFWRTDSLAPIGAGRKRSVGHLPNLANFGHWKDFELDGRDEPTPRAPRIDTNVSHFPDRFSASSSLSTTSSRISARCPSPDTPVSTQWSPAESFNAFAPSAHRLNDDSWARPLATSSTSLDFSTGRSIWC